MPKLNKSLLSKLKELTTDTEKANFSFHCENCDKKISTINIEKIQGLLKVQDTYKEKVILEILCSFCSKQLFSYMMKSEQFEGNPSSIESTSECAVPKSETLLNEVSSEHEDNETSKERELSTIDDLPNELLSLVFSYYLESEGRKKFVRNVMPVCKKWKEISSCPLLWSEMIDINIRDAVVFGQKGLLSHLQSLSLEGCEDTDSLDRTLEYCPFLKHLSLKRCKVSENFCCDVNRKCPNLTSVCLNRVYDSPVFHRLLSKEVYRLFTAKLKRVKLKFISFSNTCNIPEIIAESCPLLEELMLGRIEDRDGLLTIPVALFQICFPLLRVLSLKKIHFKFDSCQETIGFPLLEELVIDECTSINLCSIVSKSLNLKKFKILWFKREILLNIPSKTLESLSCSFVSLEDINHFTNSVSKWNNSLKYLEFVNLRFLENLLLDLVHTTNMVALQHIRIRKSGLISKEALEKIIWKWKSLKTIVNSSRVDMF